MHMTDNFALVMDSPLGKLGVALDDGFICRIDFLPVQTRVRPATMQIARQVERALEHYFLRSDKGFNLPLRLQGTAFQQRVWQALQGIPCGEMRTYGELAAQLASGARAVGNACRRNPVPVIVPCHRVVGAHGIGGYSGHTAGRELQRKRWLLAHEAAPITLEGR
jgi:methylated-DNA-[protein]-cysteine S-methyltransferase